MKNIITYLVLYIIIATFLSCDNFVDVTLPSSQLTGEKVFDDATTANAAMVDIYSKLRDTGILTGLLNGASVSMGMYSDELIYHGSGVEQGLPFTNTIIATSSITSDLWNQSYHQIYCSNAVIAGIQNSTALSLNDKNRLTGEALFVRALVHFYLVNIYGDIPYITNTEYEKNKTAGRIPSAIVYSNIISDLDQAIKFLPEQYPTGERVRPNRATANALLARVYLYNKQWAEASNSASAVLNNPAYVIGSNPEKTFLKESTSTIWQFMPKMSGNNTDEGGSFIFLSGSSTFVSLDPDLINAFESGDLRKSNWIRTVSNGSNIYYHSFKYKQHSKTATSVEYSIIFRIAEQYLIRAEARARQGELIGAKEDLNKVRNAAGLASTTAITANEIINAVLKERRVELFTEYGHRFFDLKRTEQIDAVLSPVKPGWQNTDKLWPLPETELIANPNLFPQNEGY